MADLEPDGNSTAFRVFSSRMSVTDDLLHNNEAYAESFDKGDLPAPARETTATMPIADSQSSIWIVLRSLVQPRDAQSLVDVSSMSRDRSGPRSRSVSRTCFRKSALSSIHFAMLEP